MESDEDVDCLLSSARCGDIEGVRFYIESRSVDVNSTDDIGRTALHRAAYGGKGSVVEYLLSKGANVNSKVECDNTKLSGATPLSWAVMSGHVDVAKTLIQYGATVDVMLSGYNLLGIAAISDNPSMVELVLSYSTGIDEYDSDDRTPLVAALASGKCESAQFLLQKGADYRKHSIDLHPMLVVAVQEKEGSKCTELLLKHVGEKEGKEELMKYINIALFIILRTR